MLGASTISQGGLSVLHWQRPGLTLDRGGVYKAENLLLVGYQIQGGALYLVVALPYQCWISAPKWNWALHKLESALRLGSRLGWCTHPPPSETFSPWSWRWAWDLRRIYMFSVNHVLWSFFYWKWANNKCILIVHVLINLLLQPVHLGHGDVSEKEFEAH